MNHPPCNWLFLLRHAIAVPRGTADFADDTTRPLTDEGLDKFRHAIAGLRQLGIAFDLVLSSPLVRARQTAEALLKAGSFQAELQEEPMLAPEADPGEFLSALRIGRWQAERLLVVGHEPWLGQLAALLLGATEFPLRFKKGGLCRFKLHWQTEMPTAKLDWHLTPRQLRLFGGAAE